MARCSIHTQKSAFLEGSFHLVREFLVVICDPVDLDSMYSSFYELLFLLPSYTKILNFIQGFNELDIEGFSSIFCKLFVL